MTFEQPAPMEELLTLDELAAYLKLSKKTAWRWCKSGKVPAFKVGRQWRISRRELDKFIKHQSLR